jgi:hypothetical protein
MEELWDMEEGRGITEKDKDLEGEVHTALRVGPSKLPSREFVKVEKNLASLGFFTPSSKRTRNEKSKTVTVMVLIEGKRIEAKATIAPTALFGLPITADQDKWLALHKILADIQMRDGQVTNPVSFSSAELLALLKIYKDSGKNYKDVSEWLDVMVGTTIISEGAVYISGKRTFGKDTFHVFDRAVSFGKELPDGSIADKNYVWLSQWQIQNINNHHQLPIDLDTYRQLKNYIAKALVPLLQVWLYATRDDGVFEKRYDELCQILNIRQWPYLSKIKEKLGPSLGELKQFGYLADWAVETTSDKHGYKILFFHGEKFHRDRRARLSRKQNSDGLQHATLESGQHHRSTDRDDLRESFAGRAGLASASAPQQFDPILVAEITRRGINEKKAYELLTNLKPGQAKNLVAQLEYADQTVQQLQRTSNPVRNPAGFIISLIERNAMLPDNFETSAQRTTREERERIEGQRRAAQESRQQLEWEYDEYRDSETDRYIEANAAAFEALKDAKWKEDREKYAFATESMARMAARFEMQKQITFLTFDEFVERKNQGTDFFPKPVAPSPAPEIATRSGAPEDILAADEAREAEHSRPEIAAHEATADSLPKTISAPAAGDAAVKTPPADVLRDNLGSEPIVTMPESGSPLADAALEATQPPTIVPETQTELPEPLVIEFVSDPPHEEFGDDAAKAEAA